MPPTPQVVRRADYPRNGWSSSFGGYAGIKYPSAKPYGMLVTAPGSTGTFAAFNTGVKYLIDEVTSFANTIYKADITFIGSQIPATVVISFTEGVQNELFMMFITDISPPVIYIFSYQFPMVWPNMRKKYTFPGPGVTPLPVLAQVGPVVTIQPFNRRGFELLS